MRFQLVISAVLFVIAVFHGRAVIAAEADVLPAVAKKVGIAKAIGEVLPLGDRWKPYEKGFVLEGDAYACDNGGDLHGRRGVVHVVDLDQTRPEPIIASGWSKAEGVSGSENMDYAVYLDLLYDDGTPLWGQTAEFSVGSHDWERRQVIVYPEKPIKKVMFYMFLRDHGGKAWFRDPELRIIRQESGKCKFDGLTVTADLAAGQGGFQIRDVAADSDFLLLPGQGTVDSPKYEGRAKICGLDVTWIRHDSCDAAFYDAELTDTTGKDRAVTLAFAIPVAADKLRWCDHARQESPVVPGREYLFASRSRAGSNGWVSRYPFAAVANDERGMALGIDPAQPALYRVGYSAGVGELYIAYDLGFAPEQPRAHVRFCCFPFRSQQGFRGALGRYYALFPEAFRSRTPEQGLWMPFAKISQVEGWEDFGFKFKEGDSETGWDDEHGILTFRYTEPMTWWMAMPKESPRTLDAAIAEAERLANSGSPQAQALFTSGYHNSKGHLTAQLLDTPWCNGAVWSMNSMPGIPGNVTDFKLKWAPSVQEQCYGPRAPTKLDGEYVDSSEGYVTDLLDYCRGHFASVQTPLTFSPNDHRPAILRGLIAFEYLRGIASDIHADGKLMMANGAPDHLCWLVPLVDVGGTETNWHVGGRWTPMSDAELLYRRSLCRGKPYCFLMNTKFDEFPSELVEKYMKRCLAYGMFPGFFSADASTGHYFTRPELYNRDRPLFKRYVPLCKRVAEAGWEPITLAKTDDDHVHVERFGDRYLTVFNDSAERRTVTLTLDGKPASEGRNLLSGDAIPWRDQAAKLSLDPEDVAVIEVPLVDRCDARIAP